MVSCPAARSRFHCSRWRKNTCTRTWSGTRRLKSGDSGAKCPTSSGLVAMLFASRGIAHGHRLVPPPHSAGSVSPGLMELLGHFVSLPDIAPCVGSAPFDGALSLQKIDEIYSAK